MKKILGLFCALLLAPLFASVGPATYSTQTTFQDRSITVGADGTFTQPVLLEWACDDVARMGLPARIELLDGAGGFLGRVTGTIYRATGPWTSASGPMSLTVDSHYMFVWAGAMPQTPADGAMHATLRITGAAPGAYTLRYFIFTNWQIGLHATTVWTYAIPDGETPPPKPDATFEKQVVKTVFRKPAGAPPESVLVEVPKESGDIGKSGPAIASFDPGLSGGAEDSGQANYRVTVDSFDVTQNLGVYPIGKVYDTYGNSWGINLRLAAPLDLQGSFILRGSGAPSSPF
jgi:hypothetical protein